MKKSAAEAHRMLSNTYGEAAISERTCREWFQSFKNGDFDVKDQLCVVEIGSRVGPNQTTVMRICDYWMKEDTTDQRGRSHPPQCTTSLSARTLRHRLQQSCLSARSPLLGLPLTQNLRRLRHQWCDERRMRVAEWNEVVFTVE
ncbi:transposable element Tcb1 transposase [Trichonephila clavipes]|nr:transposable element Tcb1 transposase [Trichonephila clavipes]